MQERRLLELPGDAPLGLLDVVEADGLARRIGAAIHSGVLGMP
jgi:hypothetical protein